MRNFLQDIRYGFRNLQSKPGITIVALLTLALGIGANTALFSILYSVLWKPLPYKDPGRLVIVWETDQHRQQFQNVANPANYWTWRERNEVFEDMAGFLGFSVNLSGDGSPEEVSLQYATPNLFDVLGVRAVQGRTFASGDGVGEDRSVILSYGLWQRRYGGKSMVGKQILLNGRKAIVVGIMPRDFEWFFKQGSMTSKPPQLWVAFPITPQVREGKGRFLTVVARLKPGISVQAAQSNMSVIAKQLESERDFDPGWGANVVPLREQLSGELRRPLWVLAGAVGFVLLIACTNVANLMLSRAVSRSREMAVRAALGAGRFRIVRQVLTENLVLSILGGAAGVMLAVWGTQALGLVGQRAGIDFESVRLNLPVLAFAFLISICSGLIFGIIPALSASRRNLYEQLKDGRSATGGTSGRKIQNVMVAAQLAFALILLAGAALLIQSFLRLTSVDPGFDPKQVLTFRILLPSLKYPEDAHRISFFHNAVEKIRSLPGVTSAGMTSFLPFAGPASGTNFLIQGKPDPPPGQDRITEVFAVDDGFFKTLEIPLARGRMFTSVEMNESRKVVLINEALARKYFSGENPIGKKLTIFMHDVNEPNEIIGIVGDIKHKSLADETEPSVYWPHPEMTYSFMTLVVRTNGDAMALAPAAAVAIHQLDPDQPLADVRTLQDWMGDSTARSRFNMLLLAILAGVALTLSISGVHAVMSHAVIQRTREMGIRMALGANSRDMLRLVVKEASRLILTGLITGCAAAFALTRLMKSMLFETSTTDPVLFIAVILMLLFSALIACWIPSRRASKVNPVVVLRYE